tara:strand:- start:24 stop:356 length:333 start_codon:yes stop_codon:yes gene_type:complete
MKKNSLTKALLFVIALSTSIMAVQLIPISRKAYLYNLCRDYLVYQEQSYSLSSGYESGKEEEEKNFAKAVERLNINMKKLKLELEKELNLYPSIESQEQPAAFCQKIGIK